MYAWRAVLITDRLLPPFADILDWDKFSVRVPWRRLGELKTILLSKNHTELHSNLRRVRGVFRYTNGGEGGVLPLLVFSMHRRLAGL